MLPKATGREARVEKKKIRAETRREREISPGECEYACTGPDHLTSLLVQILIIPKSMEVGEWVDGWVYTGLGWKQYSQLLFTRRLQLATNLRHQFYSTQQISH